MSANLNDLDPMSAEYEEAIRLLQEAEDAELEGTVTAESTNTDEATPEAPSAVVEAEKKVDAEPVVDSVPEKVAGIASKDGSRVLPYAALQAERRAARQERGARERVEAELAQTRQQLEDLKSGKTAAENPDELTAEELEQLNEFPVIAKMARTLAATKEQLVKAQKAVATQTRNAEPEVDPVDAAQEAVDQIPLLSEWQANDREKFARAVEIDAVMRNSPKWKDKPMEARFAHVTKQVADEFDVQIPDEKPLANTSADKANAVIDKAKRVAPNTLSDFKGGQVDQTTERISEMSNTKMFARMSQMSDAEIDEHLRSLG